MAIESVSLDASAIPDLRRMLAIGLAALGELERVHEQIELLQATGQQVPDLIRPVHPTGAHESGHFASALMWLDSATPIPEAA